MSSLIPPSNYGVMPIPPLQAEVQPIDLSTSHKVLVGLALLVVVGMILTEGAGHSKDAAAVIIMLLVGVFMIEGMTHSQQFLSFASNNPFNPIPSTS